MNIGRVIMTAGCLTLLGAGTAAKRAMAQTEIRTAEEFAAVADASAGEYILMNDLTLDGWIPPGGDGEGFSGTFDGNGHTVTIAGFDASADRTRVGLFGTIEKDGVVKNLRVAGEAGYTGGRKILYIGGIAGLNYGMIARCLSDIALRGAVEVPEERAERENDLPGSEDGVFGGCIAGVNAGRIADCYSTGSVSVSGNRLMNYAGGIAGANGHAVRGGISIGVSSGGGVSVGATQGTAAAGHLIVNCYSAASVFSEAGAELVRASFARSATIAKSGGIAAHNHVSGAILRSVSLNGEIEARGRKGGVISALPTASAGLGNYRNNSVFFSGDILPRRYREGEELKPDRLPGNNAVALSATREESWWRYPDGTEERQREQAFGFAFGNDEQSPWVWDGEAKRPALRWEKKSGE